MVVEELVPDCRADGAAEGWVAHEALVTEEVVPLVVVEEDDETMLASSGILIIMRHYC